MATDTLMAQEATSSTSFGNTEIPTLTAESSSPSVTLPKVVKRRTVKPQPAVRERKRRKSKVNSQTLLEIAQSTLARLHESGVQVYAKQDGDNILVTIIKAEIVENKFVVKK